MVGLPQPELTLACTAGAIKYVDRKKTGEVVVESIAQGISLTTFCPPSKILDMSLVLVLCGRIYMLSRRLKKILPL